MMYSRSYSWSANICGEKIWTFYSPEQEQYLRNANGELVYDIRAVDPKEFPNFHKTQPIVVHQRPGEVIFVPSNWFHQVENKVGDLINRCRIVAHGV
jgi:hypothetical protein